MYHFDKALQVFLERVQSALGDKTQEVIVLRDVYGRLSCHLLGGEEVELLSQIKENLVSDAELEAHCASPPVVSHEPDDPIWNRMREMGQPLVDNKRIKMIERILEGRSWLEPTRSPFETPPPYIIAFYSFKGGVGRTTAAALVALKLARQGKRICLIDFDLEAPGLSSLASDGPSARPPVGVIDYLLERRLASDSPLPMDDYVIRIADREVENNDGALWVVPAGTVNEQYLNKLGRLDFQAMLTQDVAPSTLGHLFQDLQAHIPFDYYVVDSRTGITDIGGLALNGLSHLNVMFFGLGEQNVRGMNFVLRHLRPLLKARELSPEQIAGRLLIVFSPIPWGRGRRKDEEIESTLRQIAYDVMLDHIYGPLWPQELSFPDVGDDEIPNEPVPHHPVIIPYLEDLPLQDTLEEMDYVQGQHFSAPYDQLARRILDVKLPLLGKSTPIDEKSAMSADELASIRQGLASLEMNRAAEDDLDSENVLRERFLPLPHFRFLFDPKAFLILGRKGSGKSALFQVLHFPKYVADLADYFELPADRKKDVQTARWIVGFSRETHDFLSADKLSELDRQAREKDVGGFYTRFWKYLAVRSIQRELGTADSEPVLSNTPQAFAKQLFDPEIASRVERFLESLEDEIMYPNTSRIYLVYDYLDRILPAGDLTARARYLSGLVDWWQSRVLRGKRLLSKVFLREDIFHREVKVRLEDASKIAEGVSRYTIRWSDRDNLYRLFLKRAFGVLKEHIERGFPAIYQEFTETQVGIIPPGQEDALRPLIEWLVGEYMGASKRKGYVYTWIPRHLSDSKGQVAPRWVIALFAQAAKLADDNRLDAPIIPQKMIQQALQEEVSGIAIEDLRIEYKDEFQAQDGTFLPDFFHQEFSIFPQSRKNVLDSVESKIREKDANTILAGLEEIGLLERRKSTTRRPHEHYQIPDIFLYGLGLTRKG